MKRSKQIKQKPKLALLMGILVPVVGTMIISLSPALAQNSQKQPQAIDFQPQITLPIVPFNQTNIPVGEYATETQGSQIVGIMKSSLLAKYIKALYDYGLMIGGILAAVVLMAGGLLWLLSAGNDSRISQAKEMITGSVVGLVILFGSWVILDTINPNLTKLQTLNTQVLTEANPINGCCVTTNTGGKTIVLSETQGMCSSTPNSVFHAGQLANPDTNKCEIATCCLVQYEHVASLGARHLIQIISLGAAGHTNLNNYNKKCIELPSNQCNENQVTNIMGLSDNWNSIYITPYIGATDCSKVSKCPQSNTFDINNYRAQ